MKRTTFQIILLTLFSLSIVGAYLYNFNNGFVKESSSWGDFGSYIGGTLGSLFTLISVYFLYLTLQKQIEFSRKQDIENKILQFENNFFKLLNVQRDIYNSMNGNVQFRRIRTELYNNIKYNCESNLTINGISNSLLSNDRQVLQFWVSKVYSEIYLRERHILSHYLRHFYSILQYVDKTIIEDKSFYYDILSAQLNDDELFILFYNTITINEDRFYRIFDDNGILNELTSAGRVMEVHGNSFFPKTFPDITSIEDFKNFDTFSLKVW